MKKNFKKWLCLVLAVALLTSTLPLIAGALAPSGGSAQGASSSEQAPLKVEIKSNKDKYILLGKMEFTATITNTSSSSVENISAQALLGSSLRPLKNGSQFTATRASLAPNESFSFTYYADLNGLKGLDNLLLPLFWISSLLHGGKADVDGGAGGSDFTEATKTVGLISLFGGQYDASTKVRVWYTSIADSDKDIYSSRVQEENIDFSTGIYYANNELLITFNTGTSKQDINQIISSIDGKIVGAVTYIDTYQIRFESSKTKKQLDDLILYLDSLPQVDCSTLNSVSRSSSPDIYYPIDTWNGANWDENLPSGENWNVEYIQAPSAWIYRNDLNRVNVGLLDTKVDFAHEDLIGTEVNPASTNEVDFHGTHVSGTIGATFDNGIGVSGVAPNANLFGYEFTSEVDDAMFHIEALSRLIIENGVKVINFSMNNGRIEGFAADRGNSNAINYFENRAKEIGLRLKKLLDNKYEFLIVTAAGNNNDIEYVADNTEKYGYREANENDINRDSGNVSSLYNSFFNAITISEVREHILVVGSFGRGAPLPFRKSTFSNMNPDIFAPGERVYSTLPENFYGDYFGQIAMSGTSMAAPHVTGVAAMVWGASLSLSGADVKNIIINTSTKLHVNNAVIDNTVNVVNAKNAVEEALNRITIDFVTITGAVIEQGTNAPLSGVLVQASKVGSPAVVASDTTNTSGQYLLMVEPNATYNLKFTRAGYVEQTLANIIVVDSTMTLSNVTMAIGLGDFASITGAVVEQGTDAPLSGVLVQATKAGSPAVVASDTTNASGQYLLMVEPNTTYNLKFTKTGYDEQTLANVNVGGALALGDVVMAKLDTGGTFAGGTGTELDPYLISTPAQLNNVRDDLSAHYKLTNDIDLASWGNWEPIGNINDGYISGVFDGNGHVIRNMTINGGKANNYGELYAGLFICLNGAIVKNLGIVNSDITGPLYIVGTIVGYGTNSTISNCYSTGNINSNNSTSGVTAGGIVGIFSNGTINDCYNTGAITGVKTNGEASAGGIAGYSSSTTIINCRNTGGISATATNAYAYAGGIVASARNSITINTSYNTGTVNAISDCYSGAIAHAGGITVGSSILENCYNTGGIYATTGASSFATCSASGVGGQIIKTCYNTGTVMTNGNSPGYGLGNGNFSYGYYLDTSGYASFGGNEIALTATQMKQQASFFGFDFTTVWAISPTVNNGYPYLRGMQP